MTWLERYSTRHLCDRPMTEPLNMSLIPGDKWQCDDCKKIWTVSFVWRGDQREPLDGRPQIAWYDSK